MWEFVGGLLVGLAVAWFLWYPAMQRYKRKYESLQYLLDLGDDRDD